MTVNEATVILSMMPSLQPGSPDKEQTLPKMPAEQTKSPLLSGKTTETFLLPRDELRK